MRIANQLLTMDTFFENIYPPHNYIDDVYILVLLKCMVSLIETSVSIFINAFHT